MLSVLSLAAGALWGALRARRLGGSPFDIAQYAAVFGLVCALLGTLAGLVLARILTL